MKFFKLFGKKKNQHANRYGFIKPNGTYIYGKEKGYHNDIAIQHGFGKNIYSPNADVSKIFDDKARDAAIKVGWVRFRFHEKTDFGSILDITFNPLNQNATANALALIHDNPNMSGYYINNNMFIKFSEAATAIKFPD